MKKFISTLFKSSIASFLAMFLLIHPFSVMVLAMLDGIGVLDPSVRIGEAVIFSLTAVLFISIWVYAYADGIASLYANLRMKWALRGIGKD